MNYKDSQKNYVNQAGFHGMAWIRVWMIALAKFVNTMFKSWMSSIGMFSGRHIYKCFWHPRWFTGFLLSIVFHNPASRWFFQLWTVVWKGSGLQQWPENFGALRAILPRYESDPAIYSGSLIYILVELDFWIINSKTHRYLVRMLSFLGEGISNQIFVCDCFSKEWTFHCINLFVHAYTFINRHIYIYIIYLNMFLRHESQ